MSQYLLLGSKPPRLHLGSIMCVSCCPVTVMAGLMTARVPSDGFVAAVALAVAN